jgi:hypothetical protein
MEFAWPILLARSWKLATYQAPGEPASSYGALLIATVTVVSWETAIRVRHVPRFETRPWVIAVIAGASLFASVSGFAFGFEHEPLSSLFGIVTACLILLISHREQRRPLFDKHFLGKP